MTRILIVCLGNICRSPTAEAVLRAKLDAAGISGVVDSAGTGDWHVGDPPHPPMIRAAARAGYDLSPLRARQFTPADFDEFDLILAADPNNLRDIEAQRPAGHETPVRLLAPFAETGTEEVPDPYYTKDFDGALRLIERACDGVVDQLQ
ncbi:low molecular weight protein-tyrosine-phosphatase [Palleronia pelagia]|uniref:protein-tyrosine-phosphatase n=1 Tax=Palleronia pelagia TaxID=387096 RepID=A0A1H8APM5_9RHOB|nr:low molecular weight protein-tyrosine-phosphatase [Palleronia pelagia]SEM72661.1 protein-tyrosine phosphatase [Palleronia pelagia]